MSERRCGICGYIDELCRCFGTGPLPEPQEGAPSEVTVVGGPVRNNSTLETSCDSPELAAIRKWRREDIDRADRPGTADNVDALLRMVDELTYQLAEERNATANDRDPSYHEDKLRMENGILARLYADLGMVSESRGRRIAELESYAQSIAKECDDLRANLVKEEQARLAVERVASNYERELHDLRAKLAIADNGWTESAATATKLAAKCVEWEKREIELEAKLVVVEMVAEARQGAIALHERRIGELEAKLAEADRRAQAHLDAWVVKNDYLIASTKRAEAAEARVRTLTNALFSACGGHVDIDKLDEGDGL